MANLIDYELDCILHVVQEGRTSTCRYYRLTRIKSHTQEVNFACARPRMRARQALAKANDVNTIAGASKSVWQYTMRIYALTVLSALLVLCVAKSVPSSQQGNTGSTFIIICILLCEQPC